jgi:hypothetical protein
VGPYISPGMTESVRRMFEGAIQHTYTRVPYTYVAHDVYTNVVGTAGTPVTNVPCRYLPKPLIREHDTGRATLVVPAVTDDTLLVHWDDPITVGDHVVDIRALPVNGESEGRLLLSKSVAGGSEVAGEAVVISEADHAGLGPVTLRRLVLRDPEEQEVVPIG